MNSDMHLFYVFMPITNNCCTTVKQQRLSLEKAGQAGSVAFCQQGRSFKTDKGGLSKYEDNREISQHCTQYKQVSDECKI